MIARREKSHSLRELGDIVESKRQHCVQLAAADDPPSANGEAEIDSGVRAAEAVQESLRSVRGCRSFSRDRIIPLALKEGEGAFHLQP